MIHQHKAFKIILIIVTVGCLFYPRREEKASAADWGTEQQVNLHHKNFTDGFYINITTFEKNTAQIEYAFNEETNQVKCNNLDQYDVIWNSVSFVAMKDYYLMLFKTAHLGDTCVYLPRNRNINPSIFTHVYAIDTEIGKLASYQAENNRFLIFNLSDGKAIEEPHFFDEQDLMKCQFAGFVNGRFSATLGS